MGSPRVELALLAPSRGVGWKQRDGVVPASTPASTWWGKQFAEILLTLCLTVKQTGSAFPSRKRTAKTSEFQEVKLRQTSPQDAGDAKANRPRSSLSHFSRTERGKCPLRSKVQLGRARETAAGKRIFSAPPHKRFFLPAWSSCPGILPC